MFGDSVLSLRLPSILAMAAAVALTGELGRRLLGPAAALNSGSGRR
jgi:mannosyltransferase